STSRARSPRATTESATSTCGPGTGRSARTTAAPAARAAAACSCPSVRSPRTATNTDPGPAGRESVTTPPGTSRSGSTPTGRPPTARASWATVSWITGAPRGSAGLKSRLDNLSAGRSLRPQREEGRGLRRRRDAQVLEGEGRDVPERGGGDDRGRDLVAGVVD